MKTTTRAGRYLKAGNINNVWNMCSKAQKRYAAHLVSDYGYPVRIALQTAYIHGYDVFQYDYRAQSPVREQRKASYYGF